jgi:ABC-type Fe3+/spermidine/putrescine transport system ATPase subunit
VTQINIQLDNVSHHFGDQKVIDRVSINVDNGDLVALLGPSGCGKSTLLKLIAGIIPISQGDIYFGGKKVNLWSSKKRNAVLMFQNYALFPHMTVEENIGYGLKMKNTNPEVRQEKVEKIMEKVQLIGYGKRMINELSGGQQQRVALARALVVEPDVLLFDEPLSNLDKKLRVSMRREIREIQKDVGITSIYVTHDQEESMAIANRIIIMRDGKIEQQGNPMEVYERPVNSFVAKFMGDCNIFESHNEITMCRPDTIRLSINGTEEGIVSMIEYLGSIQRVNLSWRGRQIVVEAFTKQIRDYPFRTGDVVRFDFDKNERVSIKGS